MTQNVASEVDARIGKFIRERRAKLGLTQSDLGNAIGVTFQQVQKYEGGVNRVSAATLLKVADALQCSVTELYGLPDPNGKSHSERTILKLWQEIREPQRDVVVAMIRAFLKADDQAPA